MSDGDTVDATFYVQIAPTRSQWGEKGKPKAVVGARAATMTQAPPMKQSGGTVLVKLTVRIPKSVFMPLRPEAVVVVPAELTIAQQSIEVIAGDARAEESQ